MIVISIVWFRGEARPRENAGPSGCSDIEDYTPHFDAPPVGGIGRDEGSSKAL